MSHREPQQFPWAYGDAEEQFKEFPEEQRVGRALGAAFTINYADRISKARSTFSIYIARPHQRIAERFGFSDEVLILYHPYSPLQARAIEVIDDQLRTFRTRVDPSAVLLISDDAQVEARVQEILAGKGEPGQRTIIPIAKTDLLKDRNGDWLRDQMARFLGQRDLFDMESPITNDSYFFGREDIVNRLTNRLRSGQNSGLFGLRKMGKTSVIFALQRRCEPMKDIAVIYIDCQSPSIYQRRWHQLLAFLAEEAARKLQVEALSVAGFTAETATRKFLDSLSHVAQSAGVTRLVFALDEIENITFNLSIAKHWNEDFLPFWQAMRSTHQQTNGLLVYSVVGVSPVIAETPYVSGADNPVFYSVGTESLPPFDTPGVKQMLNQLGRRMGLRFTADIAGYLTDHYGGHPFLIRKACSLIVQKLSTDRPQTVMLDNFRKIEADINTRIRAGIEQILASLVRWYPDEYDLLHSLAEGETRFVQDFSASQPLAIQHLIDYGLVSQKSFDIRVGAISSYLRNHGRTLKRETTELFRLGVLPEQLPPDQQLLELLSRTTKARNSLELDLRELMKRVLKVRFGPQAFDRLSLGLIEARRAEILGHNLDSALQQLYFSELQAVILHYWEDFRQVFGNDKTSFRTKTEYINKYRADAHAKPITPEETNGVEGFCSELQHMCKEYL